MQTPKDDATKRLNYIEGHLRGIRKMVEEERAPPGPAEDDQPPDHERFQQAGVDQRGERGQHRVLVDLEPLGQAEGRVGGGVDRAEAFEDQPFEFGGALHWPRSLP